MVPAGAVDIASAKRQLTKTRPGPNLSHKGPQTRHINRVAARTTMSEFANSFRERCRSFLIADDIIKEDLVE